MKPRPLATTLLILAFGLSLAGGLACRSARSDSTAVSDAPGPALPQLVVRDDSEGLTFSYITLDGGFQLAKKVADVPYEARDSVRVWSEVSGDGIVGPWVYVADLRNKLVDGTYKVDVVARAQFDELAEERRKKSKTTAQKPAGTQAAKDDPPAAPSNGKVRVIIYGADWCKPCHLAEAFLKRKGVPFEHKDIDDPSVNEEMRDKLQQAGIKTHSIPVLDVNGKLLVGFSEPELESAIKAAGG